MKYIVNVRGTEIDVDELEFGVMHGSPEGNVDLYVRIEDREEDIYTSEDKKTLWTEWLNACCEDKNNPKDRIRRVEAKVYGGENDAQLYRSIVIEHGYLASFVEMSGGTDYEYEVVLKRAPRKAGEVSIVAG